MEDFSFFMVLKLRKSTKANWEIISFSGNQILKKYRQFGADGKNDKMFKFQLLADNPPRSAWYKDTYRDNPKCIVIHTLLYQTPVVCKGLHFDKANGILSIFMCVIFFKVLRLIPA